MLKLRIKHLLPKKKQPTQIYTYKERVNGRWFSIDLYTALRSRKLFLTNFLKLIKMLSSKTSSSG